MRKDVIQENVIPNEGLIVMVNQSASEVRELYDDPALSYSDTSSDSGGLPLPSNGMVTNPRR